MKRRTLRIIVIFLLLITGAILFCRRNSALAQLNDRTQNPNVANFGIAKSLTEQIGAGTGDWTTPDSSSFLIARDPFRAIRRGRQLFQRKFVRSQGHGPISNDGAGDINNNLGLGAGLSDSCAGCHGRPRGSAGSGGDVVTRPDSRDAPHLFGLGLKEMLAEEITSDLRAIRAQAINESRATQRSVTKTLESKGINFGIISVHNGQIETSQVRGVDSDLRVRPFFAHGGKISIRESLVGAFNEEMGLQSVDPDLMQAHNGSRIITRSGMVLDGAMDKLEQPPTDLVTDDPDHDGVTNELPASLVDFMEFYLLNYFKPALYQQTRETDQGRRLFTQAGCAGCHVADLQINKDRRVAEVETVFNQERGIFNNLFATAIPLFNTIDDHLGLPSVKAPRLEPFLVKN